MDFVKEIEYYCRQENTSGALLVNGNWGSGKHTFLKKFCLQNLGLKIMPLLSVFLYLESQAGKYWTKTQRSIYFKKLIYP